MTTRFVNTAILVLIGLLTLSGLYGLVWHLQSWVYHAHRIFAWALIALIPWKAAISLRSLKRPIRLTFDRGLLPAISTLLSGATLLVIVLGLAWAWQVGPHTLWLRETVLSWHWILALVIVPPFILHAWRRWPKPRQSELLSRAAFLKIAGLGVFGLLGWRAGASLATARQATNSPRRVSGSRLDGYLSANRFPVTTGAGDGGREIDLDVWRLQVTGAVNMARQFTYPEVLAMPSESRLVSLDCTIGWYTVQRWRGIPLRAFLALVEAEEGISSV